VTVAAGTARPTTDDAPSPSPAPEPADADADVFVAWSVVLRRADGTVERTDPAREVLAAQAGAWRCRIGAVSSSRQVAIANGRVQRRGEETRQVDCARGVKHERGIATCRWGSAAEPDAPIAEATLTLEEPAGSHRLTLRCEVTGSRRD
jgi:hypothetical protein